VGAGLLHSHRRAVYCAGQVAESRNDPEDSCMRICTTGFRGKSAREFFALLKKAGVQKLLDIRRRNQSQLAGFTKGSDLGYFLEECFGIKYEHIPLFAPSEELLDGFHARLGKRKCDDATWGWYVEQFTREISGKPIMERFLAATMGSEVVCLLCTEETAERCHRRLIAEHVAERVEGTVVEHL
jgi:uncharacterized protein (DUF488 family)